MIPLFGESEADDKRDLLEERLISMALQLLRLGTDVHSGLQLLGEGRAFGAALVSRA